MSWLSYSNAKLIEGARWFKYDDGGRLAAGIRGSGRDCVTRAIAIAAEIPYPVVATLINENAQHERPRGGRGTITAGVPARQILFLDRINFFHYRPDSMEEECLECKRLRRIISSVFIYMEGSWDMFPPDGIEQLRDEIRDVVFRVNGGHGEKETA